MKKLLYLIPLVFIALSAAGISLHKDTVSYKAGADLQSLTPSHWKLQDYSLNVSVDLSKTANTDSQQFKAYSDGAKFYGFPFGAYFTNKQNSSVSGLDVSAYSWLWGLVDGLIIIIALLLAWIINRMRPSAESLINSLSQPQPMPTSMPIQPPPQQIVPQAPDPVAIIAPQVIQPQSSPPPPGNLPV